VDKDGTLTKTHFEYIESRLVDLATSAKQSDLRNGNVPRPPSISPMERCRAEDFLNDCLDCLRACGVDLFDQVQRPPSGLPPSTTAAPAPAPGIAATPSFIDVTINGKGVQANGRYMPTRSSLTVLKGSQAVPDTNVTPTIPDGATKLRGALVENKVLQEENGTLVFQQDYEFRTPTAASGVILGASTNGWDWWKDSTGRSLNQIFYPASP